MKVGFELVNWLVLAVIVAAVGYGDPLASRFVGAAGVWVGIVNAAAVIVTVTLLNSPHAQARYRDEQRKRSFWDRAYGWIFFIAAVAVFAYAGWLWSFGIRLVHRMVSETFARQAAKELA